MMGGQDWGEHEIIQGARGRDAEWSLGGKTNAGGERLEIEMTTVLVPLSQRLLLSFSKSIA